MTVQTNNAEATVGAGVTVTTSNQGGAISAAGAYNTVTGAHTFDSGSHFDGALCYTPACVTATSYVLQRSGFTVTVFRKRFYFKIDATPTVAIQFLALRNASAAMLSARWNTNNTISVLDAASSAILTSGTLTPGNWYGIDMVLTPNSSTTTGDANVAIYDNAGTTIASAHPTNKNLGSAAVTIFQMTRPAVADTTAVHFDTDTWDDASTLTTLFGPFASPIAGTLAASTPVLTGALTGDSTDVGTVAAATPVLAGSINGASVNVGSLAATTPTLTGAVSGASTNPGSLTAATPVLTGSIAGSSTNRGTVAAATPVLTGTLSGNSILAGTVAAKTPTLAASLSGTETNTASLSAKTPLLTSSIHDTTTVTGTLVAATPTLTASLTGVQVNVGTMNAKTPVATSALTGASVNIATLTATAPIVTSTIAGVLLLYGLITARTPLLLFSATNAVPRDITVTGSLGDRRWVARLNAKTLVGALTAADRTGSLTTTRKTASFQPRRWAGTL